MKKIFGNNTVNNTLWLIGEKIFSMLLGLITVSIVARYLGPEGYGTLNYAITFVAVFSVFSTLGLLNVTVKAIVQKEDDEGTIVFTTFIMRVCGNFIVLILSLIAIYMVNIESEIQIYLILIMVSVYFIKSLEVLDYWTQAYQKAYVPSKIKMGVVITSTLLKILIVYLDLGIIYIGLVYLIEAILIYSVMLIVYLRLREEKSAFKFKLTYAKLALSQSWYLILTGMLVTVYTSVDKILVGEIVSKQELGLLMAAIAVSNLWFFIPQALITSFSPIIMKLKQENENEYLKKLQQLYSQLFLINIICAILIFICSDFIISILYGDAYKESSNLLTISVWAGVFSVFGQARGIWMLCEGIQKYSIYYIGLGASFSLGLNMLFIPKYGAYGAVMTLLLTEILTTVIAPAFFKETRLFTKMFLNAMRLKHLK